MSSLPIGCVKCGRSKPPPETFYAQCPTCGKTVGICRPCSRYHGNAQWLLDESMDWHRLVKHGGRLRVLLRSDLVTTTAKEAVDARENT